jgi:hypothetical protein
MAAPRLGIPLFAGLLAAVACSGQAQPGVDTTTAAASGNQSTGLGNPGRGTPEFNGKKANYCGTAGCACSNGVDDDGDGLSDADDPECVGAMDDDESSFATGMPGDNRDPKWQDCFFDGNSGAGDDRCRYPTGCLTGAIPQGDPACAIAQYCLDYCAALTPRNCDCFGCCTVQSGNEPLNILLTSSCTADKLGDSAACPRCVKSSTCQPPTTPPPPPPTTPPPPPPTTPPPPPSSMCTDGLAACSDTADCGMSFVCEGGCCRPVVR